MQNTASNLLLWRSIHGVEAAVRDLAKDLKTPPELTALVADNGFYDYPPIVAKTQTLQNAYGFKIDIRRRSECPLGSAMYDGVLGRYIHLQRL